VPGLVAFAAQAAQLPGQESIPVAAVVFDVVGDRGDAYEPAFEAHLAQRLLA
jgi:hypothetical protein